MNGMINEINVTSNIFQQTLYKYFFIEKPDILRINNNRKNKQRTETNNATTNVYSGGNPYLKKIYDIGKFINSKPPTAS